MLARAGQGGEERHLNRDVTMVRAHPSLIDDDIIHRSALTCRCQADTATLKEKKGISGVIPTAHKEPETTNDYSKIMLNFFLIIIFQFFILEK